MNLKTTSAPAPALAEPSLMQPCSRGPRAEIRFTRQPSFVSMEIRDMGQGIPADMLARIEDTKGGWGVGLSGMQERLRPFGGRLELESGPTGTTIRAVMPLGQGPPKPPLIA